MGTIAIDRRQGWALGATALVHLLVVLCWQWERTRYAMPGREAPASVLMLLPFVRRPAPPTVRPRASAPAPASHDTPAPAPEPARAPEPAPAAAAGLAPDPVAADVRDQALRSAGRIDKQLRGSAQGVPKQRPDTPLARMEKRMEGAYNDESKTLIMDSYEAPDGVVIYRFRQSGHVRCMSGSKPIHCPPDGVGWTR